MDTPFGKRPFRVHIDPTQDGAEVVNAVSDRVRAKLLLRIGLGDLLTPRDVAVQSHPCDTERYEAIERGYFTNHVTKSLESHFMPMVDHPGTPRPGGA